MLKTNSFPSGRMICVRISPDFMHLIKRFRYLLLSNRVHMNFMSDYFIDINEIRKVLVNVPEIVFWDISITKMHDSSPIKLFYLHNFLILFDRRMFDAAAYFFQISLSLMAYNNKNVGYQLRLYLFEISLWYIVYYKMKLNQYDGNKLRQRKYKDEKDVVAYSDDLIIEFSNNLFSNTNLMEKIDNINFDMNSTAPLEHTFGRARVKAHYIHTIQKFIRVVGFMNQNSHKRSIDELEKIKGRTSSFGVTVEDRDKNEFFFSSTPQQIAMDFINLLFKENNNNEFCHLYSFVEYIRDYDEVKRSNTLNINTITLGTQQTKTIIQRMTFQISNNQNEFIDFLKKELPDKKIKKQLIVSFYQILVENAPLFPNIDKKRGMGA